MRKYTIFFIWFSYFLLFFFSTHYAQFYSGYGNPFGKNRVRFKHDWTWRYYAFEKYDLYTYEGGLPMAQYIGKIAEKEIEQIEGLFGFSLKQRFAFLVFQNYTDFKQNNIGLYKSDKVLGGMNMSIDNKAFLYLEGDYQGLRRQIRSRIGEIVLNQMMDNGLWQETWKGSFENEIPGLFFQGLLFFIEEGFYDYLKDKTKEYFINNKKLQKMNRLSVEDEKWVGAALWNFLYEKFGKTIFSNVLYAIKIFNGLENGLKNATGYSLKELYEEAGRYYQRKYENENYVLDQQGIWDLKTRKNRHYGQFSINFTGDKVLWVMNESEKYKIFLGDLYSNKQKIKNKQKIFKKENKTQRMPNYQFPIVKWHPNGEEIWIATQRLGKTRLYFYDLKTGKKTKKEQGDMSQILDFNFSPSGEKVVFSGVKNGDIQLFLYTKMGDGFEALTTDPFDHLHPSFLDENQIVFTSNRTETVDRNSKKWEHSPYFSLYNLTINKDKTGNKKINIEKIENENEKQNIRFPFATDQGLLYLSNEIGAYNRFILAKDSSISGVDSVVHYTYNYQKKLQTALPRSIQYLQVNGKYISQIFKNNKKFVFQIQNTQDPQFIPYIEEDIRKNPVENDFTFVQKNENTEELFEQEEQIFQLQENPKSSPDYVKKTLIFGEKKNREEIEILQKIKNKSFILPEGNIYNTNFTLRDYSFEVENNTLDEAYQRFQSNPKLFNNNGAGGLFTLKMLDFFEDHYIDIGLMLQPTFTEYEALLSYKNFSKRLKKTYSLYKSTKFSSFSENEVYKYNIYLAKVKLTYPFTEFFSISLTTSYRADALHSSNISVESAKRKNDWIHWGSLKAQALFDNTFHHQSNIYFGNIINVFGEYYQEIPQKKSDLFVLGFDVRRYQRLLRNWILAIRVAGSTSFGHRRLMYYLGSTDSDLLSTYNTETPINYQNNYYFQTSATPVRGYDPNVKNGPNMLIFNLESRLPIFSFFANRRLRSGFLNDFQLIAFFDAGMAWEGWNPFSDANSYIRRVVDQGTLTLIVKKQTQPWVFASGFGLRVNLLGYFIRWDLAFRIYNFKQTGDPFNHISLGLDF